MHSVEEILFPFIGGLGLFIYGMHTMASGLQKTAGGRMRRWLEKVTNNRVMGVLIGFLVTGVIQSSSATTVMIVGFVNAGIMNVGQTVGLIMGANIGTTVTAWIVSSVEWARFLKPTTLAPFFVGIGACAAMFSTRDRWRRAGEIIVGFGVLFLGMSMMSDAVSPLSQSELFRSIFVRMGHNPLLGILAGAFVTGIIQSSSASVGILQSLASAGLVPWSAAVYIIMGQNIGTCVTAMLSSIGTSKAAKATAYIHLGFNVIGSLAFSVLAVILFKFVFPSYAANTISQTQISLVHTFFNLGSTLMLFPFADRLVSMATRLSGFKESASSKIIVHLDDRILETPSFATQSCLREISRMGELSNESLELSCDAILKLDMDIIKKINEQEENIDLLQQSITRFLAKICANPNTSRSENKTATSLFHTVNDIERVGDHAVNLAEVAEEMINEGTTFSPGALDELTRMVGVARRCFMHSMEALYNNDSALAKVVCDEESETDALQKELRANHMARLSSDECNPQAGVAFLDVVTNLERVTDHAKNIAQTVLNAAR